MRGGQRSGAEGEWRGEKRGKGEWCMQGEGMYRNGQSRFNIFPKLALTA